MTSARSIALMLFGTCLSACTAGAGVAPVVNIIAPSDGAIFDPNESIDVEFVVTDEDTAMESIHYLLQDDEEVVHEEGDMPAAGRVATQVSFADEATRTLLIIVLDEDLGTATDTVWIGIDDPTPTPTPPPTPTP